jgi:hypothetical protein
MTNLIWENVRRKVKDLVPYEFNPRKMDAKQRKNLENSLTKFGLVEIPVLDFDNVIIAGNQRVAVLAGLGKLEEEIDVRFPNRKLTELELKEYNVASNAIKASWVDDMLHKHFSELDLDKYGLNNADLDEQLEQQRKLLETQTEDPVYPVVAKFSEKYDAIIITIDNEVDYTHIKELLGLETMASYKSSAVGMSHVITAKQFCEKWESRPSL